MERTDKEYVERCRDGHSEEYGLLVHRYQGLVHSFLAGRHGALRDIEEAVQESFVRAFFSLKKLRKPESFYAWLLGIAGRVAQEQFRTQEKTQTDSEVIESLTGNIDDRPPGYPLEEAMAALPESYRQVILLKYYEGLSCLEVAQRLGMPLGTVTKMLSRAYAMLRQALEALDGNEATVGSKELP